MKATFLEAEVPLTKTFYMRDGKVEKQGHPWVIDVTSHVEEFKDIQELHALLVAHAAKGHSFLKGNVVRDLVKESRAGTTNPSEETEVLLLDIDGIKGVDTVEQILSHLNLAGTDYIVQYSSSMGVVPNRGMSAHVFMLLHERQAPAILKQYLMQWNLNVPLLKQNLGLTRTYNALRWSLDITTCQSDKLIYIAPPICKDGVEDAFQGDRIALVSGKRTRVVLPAPFPNAEANQQAQQEELNRLRKAMGLKERPKTSFKTSGRTEYMVSPDRAVVTGKKVDKDFVHLNLNGGDSWAYYHPVGNPTYIRNFKNEPVYRTQDLVPDYWAEVKESMLEAKPDAEGRVFLAFRDFHTSTYYNGVWVPKSGTLRLAVAKGKEQLQDFLAGNGQPVPDNVPDWDVRFDPDNPVVVDLENRVLNTYQPSVYMRMKPRRVTEMPPYARRIILHALGGDEAVLEHFLNWLAVIVQHRKPAETAWVLHGTQGTGKGLVLSQILRPIIGMDYVVTKRMRELDSQFNGYLEKAFIVWVDEAEQTDFKGKRATLNADLKHFASETRISIRKMHMQAYEITSYASWIFASNMNHIIDIDIEDRRFNVAVYQPLKIFPPDGKERFDERRLQDELVDVYNYLMTRDADREVARVPLNNPAKQKMVQLNRASIDVAADAILSGNLDFFWEQMHQGEIDSLPRFDQDRARAYTALIKKFAVDEPSSILREELQLMLEYTIGGMPTTPVKFSSLLKHHRLTIQPVSRGGETKRGIPVKWKVKPEWKERK